MAGLLIFFVVFALGAADPRGAASAPVTFVAVQGGSAAGEARRLTPGRMRTGALLLDAAGQARRVGTDVEISVTGPIARTVVVQRFRIPALGASTGTYVFPLPEGASVDTLRAEAGDRIIEGRIRAVHEATRPVAGARHIRALEDAAEAQPANVLTVPLRDLASGEIVTVRIAYQETVRRNGTTYGLRFPLIAAPRTGLFSGGEAGRGAQLEHADGAWRGDRRSQAIRPTPAAADPLSGGLGPLSLQVKLNAGFPVASIASQDHAVEIRRTGAGSAVIMIADGEAAGLRDFRLTWTPEATELPQIDAFRERVGENHYVLAMITPPRPERAGPAAGREIVFVIDSSRSMSGEAIERLGSALGLALDRLTPSDRFNIVRFGNEVEVLFDAPRAATDDTIAVARRLVSGLEAKGTTEMLPALKRALEDDRPDDADRQRQVILFSDGAVNNETDVFTEIAAARGRSRIFTVGIGAAANALFLRRVAEIGRGAFVEIAPDRDGILRLWSLLQRLERPAVTGLRVGWAPGIRPDVSPDPLPDLHADEPVVIAARLPSLKGDMTVTGTFRGKPWKAQLKLQDTAHGDGVAKFWARRKMAALDVRRYAGQDRRSVDAAVRDVALEHGLVSRRTRLVALEVAGPGAGMRALGTSPPDRMRPSVPSLGGASPVKSKAGPKVASARPFVGPGGRGSASIRNSATENRTVMMTVMAIFFAAMCAVTLGFWRHLRRVYASSPRRTMGRRI